MLPLSDPRWNALTGGYRIPYDPRPALQRLAASPAAASSWEELWNELHHQGDLGSASYAAVPVLVDIFANVPRHWQFYALLATIELERGRRTNPPLSDWLEVPYREAWASARGYALEDLKDAQDPLLIRSALAVLAFAARQTKRGALLIDLDEGELDDLLDNRMEWSTLYRVAG
jgi:hypothetical protein